MQAGAWMAEWLPLLGCEQVTGQQGYPLGAPASLPGVLGGVPLSWMQKLVW